MYCCHVRPQLAIFRDLSPSERAVVEQHLAVCADCRRLLAVYTEQDRLLGSLPAIEPGAMARRPLWREQSILPPRRRLGAWALASLVLLLLLTGGGVVSASRGAMPGDALYSVKRQVEAARLSLSFDDAQRASLRSELTTRRQDEARWVLEAGREVELDLVGILMNVDQGSWSVDGLVITGIADVWPGSVPPPGSLLRLRVQAKNGELIALKGDLLQESEAGGSRDTEASPATLALTPTDSAPLDHVEPPLIGTPPIEIPLIETPAPPVPEHKDVAPEPPMPKKPTEEPAATEGPPGPLPPAQAPGGPPAPRPPEQPPKGPPDFVPPPPQGPPQDVPPGQKKGQRPEVPAPAAPSQNARDRRPGP